MQPANETDSNPKKIVYFVPGQVILQVDHTNYDDPTRLIEEITTNFKKFLNSYILEKDRPISGYLLDSISIAPNQIMTRGDQQGGMQRSLVQVNVTEYATMPYNDDRFDAQTDNSILVWLVETAFERLGKEPFLSNGVSLVSLSPNWLLTGSQPASGGTGGPGSQPVPPAEPFDSNNPPFKFQVTGLSSAPAASIQHESLERIQGLLIESDNEPVDVIILDTAPPLDCEALLAEDKFPGHPILEGLRLPLTISRYDDVIEPGNPEPVMAKLNSDKYGIGIRGHHYDMSDHGLFIAGIINTIAPHANVNLVQVLNKYGAGTLWTIANGIKYAIERRGASSTPLVVNCSFTINLPLPSRTSLTKTGKIFHAHPHRDLDWSNIDFDSSMLHYLIKDIHSIFSPIIHEEILVVAAAGNDNEVGGPRPQARLPAQLTNVIGIGALKRNTQTEAEYSNVADKPERDGIAVFGGNIAPDNKADDQNGILGVYTGKFPNGTDSSGWARWSGTSFATPIIAGVLALLRGRPNTTAQEALEVIQNSKLEAPGKTHIFLVDQQ